MRGWQTAMTPEAHQRGKHCFVPSQVVPDAHTNVEHTSVMQVARRQLQRTAHFPAQPCPQDLAHWSQLRHLQFCAASKHLFLSLQKKRCLQKLLVLGLDHLCSGYPGHIFFPWRVKGEEKPLRPSGDCMSMDGRHGYVPGIDAQAYMPPSLSLFSLCHWRGPLGPGVGIFTVSWALQADT